MYYWIAIKRLFLARTSDPVILLESKKGNEKRCKYTNMDDVNVVYAGPPVNAYESDRDRWKDGNACLTIRTCTGHRCLDLESRDAVLYLGQRNRDLTVEALKMALF